MAPGIVHQTSHDEAELVSNILRSEDRNHVVQTIVQTNEQVIARVTDGIYRQPASALRELISNAYDADATRVGISHRDADSVNAELTVASNRMAEAAISLLPPPPWV
jgi:hypothetical protein